MTRIQPKIPTATYKVGVFTVITVLLFGLLATLIGNLSLKPSQTYFAEFSDATGVSPGDRVRISGVEVGSVKGVKLVSSGTRNVARVEFTVDKSVPVYRDARLELRYENVVGQRYLSVSEKPQKARSVPAGTTFPLGQTTPALNLTQVFNGFQPLFRALDPARLNTFSSELVAALQGESGSLANLMSNTAQLTNSIADRDQVIGSVISGLNTVLKTVGERDQNLTGLIVQFRDLMSGLARQSDTIGRSLPSLDRLLSVTSGTLADIRSPLKSSLGSLNRVAGSLNTDRAVLDQALGKLPFTLRTLARTASYGSWFNFYVCGFQLDVNLLGGTVNLAAPGITANERDTVCGGGIK